MYSDLGFVLHKIKYKNSSEIVKLLTPEEGRIDAVAQGSCRPKSLFRGHLQHFIETTISYRGKHELKTLIQAEQQDALPVIDYPYQVAMLYCNELLLLLNMDVDVATAIYPIYKKTIQKLTQNNDIARVLRGFEWQLCCLSGYRLSLETDTDDATGIIFHPDQGLISGHGKSACDAGTFKQFINQLELNDSQVKAISRLMRPLIHHMVNGRTIRSRELLQSHYSHNL